MVVCWFSGLMMVLSEGIAFFAGSFGFLILKCLFQEFLL